MTVCTDAPVLLFFPPHDARHGQTPSVTFSKPNVRNFVVHTSVTSCRPVVLRPSLPAMPPASKSIGAGGASVSWTGQKKNVVRIFNLFIELSVGCINCARAPQRTSPAAVAHFPWRLFMTSVLPRLHLRGPLLVERVRLDSRSQRHLHFLGCFRLQGCAAGFFMQPPLVIPGVQATP